MRYEFNETKNQVTITADSRDYELDAEELIRVGGIVDIAYVEFIVDPLDMYPLPKLRIHTTPDGVTELMDMVLCKTFAPWKKKTEKKD